MKKQVILISIFAMLFYCSLSARTIKGIVTNAKTNQPIPGVSVVLKNNTAIGTNTDMGGYYTINASNGDVLIFSFVGMQTKEVKVGKKSTINVALEPSMKEMEEVVVTGKRSGKLKAFLANAVRSVSGEAEYSNKSVSYDMDQSLRQPVFNREEYATIHENDFKEALKNPLSTFSIDVDAASYSNVRRFLNNGQNPPKDAVRIEEMINYFNYDYPQPDYNHPFSINPELAQCPWNEENLLLHIGLQGEKIETESLPPSNIVFLIDVSGSMSSHHKLPLLKKAFKLLVKQLRPQDRVAIVVYAGSSGLVLESTQGNRKDIILKSLDKLRAGGSTAGGAGLKLAYKVAAENFVEEGNNRVILATDGDFNVGPSSNAAMERLIEEKRDQNIFISVLGFGTGNYQDSKMEIIADKGNGNYAYIDNILEAKKVLVNEFGGTLFTIAKDVKIQIEFNPAVVESYRLIGYENRLLNDEDFDNDKKDAGELGSGHTVTALYEVKLATSNSKSKNELKYQTAQLNPLAEVGDEIATVKFRYKKPKGVKSKLLVKVIPYEDKQPEEMSENYKFSAAVAGFGMLLRDSKYKGNASYKSVIDLANSSKGNDEEGYRSEFIRLVKLSKELQGIDFTTER